LSCCWCLSYCAVACTPGLWPDTPLSNVIWSTRQPSLHSRFVTQQQLPLGPRRPSLPAPWADRCWPAWKPTLNYLGAAFGPCTDTQQQVEASQLASVVHSQVLHGPTLMLLVLLLVSVLLCRRMHAWIGPYTPLSNVIWSTLQPSLRSRLVTHSSNCPYAPGDLHCRPHGLTDVGRPGSPE